MAMRIRGAAGLAAIAALALLLELAALFVLGPRLVAQIQRSAPQEWVTAADVTGRTLTHAVTAAGTRAMAATARVALGARVPMERTLVVATSRSCAGVTRCRLETLRLDRSDLTELRRLRVRLRGRQLVLVVPAKILISPTPTQS